MLHKLKDSPVNGYAEIYKVDVPPLPVSTNGSVTITCPVERRWVGTGRLPCRPFACSGAGRDSLVCRVALCLPALSDGAREDFVTRSLAA